MKSFKALFRNKILLYLFSRYFIYGLQFIISLVIAVKLGPYYLGVWGFLLLIINYFQQAHFGIANSLNVLLVQHKKDNAKSDSYISNSIFLVTCLAFIALSFFLTLCVSGLKSFQKYGVNEYYIYISVIIVLQYYSQLFLNIFRVKNKIGYVTFSQSVIVILNFVVIFFTEGESLVLYLLIGNMIGCLLNTLAAYPAHVLNKIAFSYIKFSIQKEIVKKGLFLFVFNTCNVLIIISTRTFISNYYPVEQFGLFTFSYSFAHAMLLLLESLSFIIFPKLIDKMSVSKNSIAKQNVIDITNYYTTCSHFLIYVALLLFPLLIWFFPKYSNALQCLNLTAMTILMSSFGYGCGTLLIARNKEKQSAFSSSTALLFNCFLCYILIYVINVEFSVAIIASMFAYLIQTFLLCNSAYKLMGCSPMEMIRNNYPLRLVIPYVIGVVACIFEMESLLIIPLIVFLIFNLKYLLQIKGQLTRMLNNDKIFNV